MKSASIRACTLLVAFRCFYPWYLLLTLTSTGINADFKNAKKLSPEAFLADFKSRFEVPENRDIAMCADELMEVFTAVSELKLGSTVVDFGSGTGLFLRRFSQVVGETGSVLATEISDIFIDQLTKLAVDEQLGNVKIIKTTGKDLNLGPYHGTVDVVVICDVYHHLEFPKTLMRQVWRALKPDTGRLIVIDFIRDNAVHKSHPKDWIMQHV